MTPRIRKKQQADEALHGDGYFQGEYVKDVVSVLVASALSGVNAILLSAPGYGKTSIAEAVADEIFATHRGREKPVFLRLNATTGPERVEGPIDPEAALASPPKFVLVRDNTPYDPDARIVILDEVFRTNDPVLDILIDVMDRRKIDPLFAPTVWGTSNFVNDTERAAALDDRFGIYYWVQPPSSINVQAMVYAHLGMMDHTNLRIPKTDKFPTWDDILEVRKMKPGKAAMRAVAGVLEVLTREAIKNQCTVNPRRINQWDRILFRTSAFFSGTNDFTVVDERATAVLRWCWPNFSIQEWKRWSKISASVVDSLGTAIDMLQKVHLEQLKRVLAAKHADDKSFLREVARTHDGARKNLQELGESDPRVAKAIEQVADWYARALGGEDFGQVDVESLF